MRVFLLHGARPEDVALVEEFADKPIMAGEDMDEAPVRALISTCQAVYSPKGWRDDPRAAAERAFAERLGLCGVQYMRPMG